ncbi:MULTISPECIES: sugar kinase [Staphylococcus]|mgnify:CR=1 FL=1|uniref:2-dehydro-3-deoxygluconokinase n=1 Tax=Staphylococcus ureilyticus TaxID=94138 RepID=A0AB34AET9_STAUR|nr:MULTISPECIES: sugar kinase [Staphylococcus]AVL76743.1 sugar kinase [Staphylococcus cohnii]MBL0375914.1 sugar kinase [Staphylococcus sp. S75]MBL0384667.1 sugar kinase [Staphylococcus sp. S59]MBL0401196.1 sugar kinase [Staphylococcus sp. S36]MCT1915480.1 sugar kinase [Staphylococcus ureilyticus]
MTVYGFGEVLLRYTPPNYEQLKDANTFKVNVGGAELNALVTLAQFGHTTEMLTVLPNHALGHLALQKMFQTRVGTASVKYNNGRIGTYYMEESFGFRSGKVIYDREHSTFANHGEDVMEEINAQSGDFFVFTGITLAVNTMIRHQIVDVLKQLKQQGVNIVFDINFRSNLWSKETAVPIIKSILPFVDVLFFGKKDATHLLETNDLDDDIQTCAKTIQSEYDIDLMASSNRNIEQSTLQGIMLTKEKYIEGQAYTYTVLNRIGAGDAFMAGVLHGLNKAWQPEDTVDFATKCSVLQHTTNEDALSVQESDVFNLSTHFGELKR